MLLTNKKVSILMCFYERPSFLPLIVHNLKSQTFVRKFPGHVEFVIADDSVEAYRLDADALRKELAGVIDDVTYVRLDDKVTIGQKRNLLCARAKHPVVIFMDDDDYYFDTYVEYSMTELYKRRKALVGSNSMLFCYTNMNYRKLSINCISPRQIHEATMCMLKSHWEQTGGFQEKGNGEGAKLIDGHETKVNAKLDICKLMVCICHRKNTCNKAMFANLGQPAHYPFDDKIRQLIDACVEDPRYVARTKFCFKYPTRSRPEQFRTTFERWATYLSGKHDYNFVVSMDTDDATMNNDEIRAFLDGWRKKFQLEYYYGDSPNKVHAINRDMIAPTYEILVLISDDMIPQERGYDQVMVDAFAEHYPDYDGMLNFNDGLRNDWPKLCTLTVYGVKYYQRFNYIYHPDYESVYCDQEQTEVGRRLNRIKDIDRVVVKHEWTDPKFQDDLRRKTEQPAQYEKDLATFKARAARDFDIDKPPLPVNLGGPPVPARPAATTAAVGALLTVMVVALDPMFLAERVAQLRGQLGSGVAVEGHLSTDPSAFLFCTLHALALTVRTPYVTFHFPNERFTPAYVTKVLPALRDDVDVVGFRQRCSFDSGKHTFVVRSDAKATNEPIPSAGPWKDVYARNLCNWNVFRTQLWRKVPFTAGRNEQETVAQLLTQVTSSTVLDDVVYEFTVGV